jgi:hypothetical protein
MVFKSSLNLAHFRNATSATLFLTFFANRMPKKRFTTNRGGYGGASRRSYQQQQQQQQQPPKTFRNQNLSPLETISQTSRTLRTLKRDGTFDRIRRRLIESILQNETLKTYAQFAVTASSRIMRLRMQQRENNDGSNKEEKLRVDAATKMAIKRELEMDLSREVSHAAWNVLAERDGPVPREVHSEIFRERKMRFERAEKRRENKKKSSKISGRKKTSRKSVGFDEGAA